MGATPARRTAHTAGLEDGTVRLSRAEGAVEYPARFQLVLAANPCPCAPAHDRDCVCPSLVRRRYLGRLSGPLLEGHRCSTGGCPDRRQ